MTAQSIHTGNWTAWAKTTEILGECPISEPGEVWFHFGKTREEAITNLFNNDLANRLLA